MILIGGTELQQNELPFGEDLEYVTENNPSILNIKLKTVAKSPNCLAIYLHRDLQDGLVVSEDIGPKVKYFISDDQLIAFLEKGGSDLAAPASIDLEPALAEVEPEVSDIPFDPPPMTEPEEPPVSLVPEEVMELEEVDSSLPDDLLNLPNASDDIDSMRLQLEVKDRIIVQREGELKEVKDQVEELYSLQELQLMEMRNTYETRLAEAVQQVDALQQHVKDTQLPDSQRAFLKFGAYAGNFRAGLREGFSAVELEQLQGMTSKFYAFAAASGDSYYTMSEKIRALIESAKKTRAIIIDFSNDHYFKLHYKNSIRSDVYSLMLKDPDQNVANLVCEVNGVNFIPTTLYNDVALLSVDWLDILTRLNRYAGGRPVILLFNSINSFSVRYTVSKLATAMQLYVFMKSNPLILNTLYGELKFIPKERVFLVALQFIDQVKGILDTFNKDYRVRAFRDAVSWDSIGVDVQ